MKKLLEKIRKILRDRRTRRFLTRFVSGIAALVVFVTTYALVLPAITMEKQADCGIEAHQHDDSCYTEELICDLQESDGHHHDDSCYRTTSSLICAEDEHVHSVENGCYDDDGNLICEKQEHQHNEECYEEVRELTCEIPESEGHSHTDECYERVLSCGKEVHVHSTACYEHDPLSDSAVAASTNSAAAASTSAGSVSSAGMTLSFGDQAAEPAESDNSVYDNGTVESDESADENGDESSENETVEFDDSGYNDGSVYNSGSATNDGLTPSDETIYNNGSGYNDGSGYSNGSDHSDGFANEGAGETDGTNETDRSGEAASTGRTSAENTAEMTYGRENAGTGSTDAANAALTNADNSATASTSVAATDQYIPPLDSISFNTILNDRTGIYYHPVADGETVEDSSALPAEDWNRIPNTTDHLNTTDHTDSAVQTDGLELGKNDLLRVYLSYTIPAGSLNATNPVARYRLPSNLHLTDPQVKAINENINGVAEQYVDMSALEITDPDKYNAYLGLEAVEGTRTPNETIEDYLAEQFPGIEIDEAGANAADATEYISAVVRVENVYDTDGIYGEKDAYLGQDLIFTFTPYSIEKNQHEYDSTGRPTKAGKQIEGWLTLDLNMGQVDFEEPEITTSTVETPDADNESDIDEDNTDDHGEDESVKDGNNEDDQNNDADDHTEDPSDAANPAEDASDAANFAEDEQDDNDSSVEKNPAASEDDVEAESAEEEPESSQSQNQAVAIERTERTAEIVFVEEGLDEKGNVIDQISTTIKVVEETAVEAQDADQNDDQDSDNEEVGAETSTENAGEAGTTSTDETTETAVADEPVAEKDDADKNADQAGTGETAQTAEDSEPLVLMPAMSFSDSIKVTTGRPAGIDENAGGTLANAADALPKKAEVSVRVEADEGTFPAGTTMVLKAVSKKDMAALSETVTDTVEKGSDASAEDPASKTEDKQENKENQQNSDANANTNTNIKTYGFQAVDITFLDKDGNEIEPAKPVHVALTSKVVEQVREEAKESLIAEPVVVHVDDEGNAEQMDLVAPEKIEPAQGRSEEELREEAEKALDSRNKVDVDKADADTSDAHTNISDDHTNIKENYVEAEAKKSADEPAAGDEAAANAGSTLEFQTGSFSVYAIVYTVDFHYDVDGQTYDYSIKGGDTISLKELLPILNVIADDTETESVNEVQAFINDIDAVRFSDESLIKVARIDTDTTAGELKKKIKGETGAEPEYSGELTEDEIAEMDAKELKAVDWALVSLKAFDTEESLTVTMKSGEVFEIRVTDKRDPLGLNGRSYAIVYLGENNPHPLSIQSAQTWEDVNGRQVSYYKDTDSGIEYCGEEATSWTFEYHHSDGDAHYYYISAMGYHNSAQGQAIDPSQTDKHYLSIGWREGEGDDSGFYSPILLPENEKVPLRVEKDENGNFQISDGNGHYIKRNTSSQYSDLNTFSADGNSAADTYCQFHFCLPEAQTGSHKATMISAADTQTGQRIIIYQRVINADDTITYYAINGNGELDRVYDSSDSVYWQGNLNIEWTLTENGNGYYTLYNEKTGNYLTPKYDDGQYKIVHKTTDFVDTSSVAAEDNLSISLPGRDDGTYTSMISCWDYVDNATYGLKAVQGGSLRVEPLLLSQEFYFAARDPIVHDQLSTVDTVDSASKGITIKMYDWGEPDGSDSRYQSTNPNQGGYYVQDRLEMMQEVMGAGSDVYAKRTLRQGLVSNTLDPDTELPNATIGGRNLNGLFNDSYLRADNVSGLFLQSVYDETGFFKYSSMENYAFLPEGSSTFTVYEQIGTPSNRGAGNEGEWDMVFARGNFMPYNRIDPEMRYRWNKYDSELQPLPTTDPRYNERLYYIENVGNNVRPGSTNPETSANYYFGMTMEAQFAQNPSGIADNGDPMVFEFHGDDDMWVFIDGVLVLDVGGDHDAFRGSINFRTGVVKVNADNGSGTILKVDSNNQTTTVSGTTSIYEMYKAAGVYPDGTSPAQGASYESKAADYFYYDSTQGKYTTFKDFSTHDFKMIYMERGASASNLELEFNLPILEQTQFRVKKEMTETQSGEAIQSTYGDSPFYYVAYVKEGSTYVPCTRAYLASKGLGLPTYEGEVDEDGKLVRVEWLSDHDGEEVFLLRPGQTAVFPAIDDSLSWYTVEVSPSDNSEMLEHFVVMNTDNDNDASNDPKVDAYDTAYKSGAKSNEKTIKLRERVIYENKPDDELINELQIQKEVDGDPYASSDSFEFRIFLEKKNGEMVAYRLGEYYQYENYGTPDQRFVFFEHGKRFTATSWTKRNDGKYVFTGVKDDDGNNVADMVRDFECTEHTSQNGSLNNVRKDDTIVIKGLLMGTDFYVYERTSPGNMAKDDTPVSGKYVFVGTTVTDAYTRDSDPVMNEPDNEFLLNTLYAQPDQASLDALLAYYRASAYEQEHAAVGTVTEGKVAKILVVNQPKNIRLSVEKQWKGEVPSDTPVTVELKRYRSYEGDVKTTATELQNPEVTLIVYRINNDGDSSTQVFSRMYKRGTTATVSWRWPRPNNMQGGYYGGPWRYREDSTDYSVNDYTEYYSIDVSIPSTGVKRIYIYDGWYGHPEWGSMNVYEPTGDTWTDPVEVTVSTTQHIVSDDPEIDPTFTGHTFTFPAGTTDWIHEFEEYPSAGLNEQYNILETYTYFIEEVPVISNYTVTYDKMENGRIAGSSNSEKRIITNIQNRNIPVEKSWEDEIEQDGNYVWTATFELEEIEVHVDGTPENDGANTKYWRKVAGVSPLKINKNSIEADRDFENMPLYRVYPNGAVYKILYSVDETAYELNNGGTIVNNEIQGGTFVSKWDKYSGLDSLNGDYYAPSFEHDAGDADDDYYDDYYDNLPAGEEGIPREEQSDFYHIVIKNVKSTVTVTDIMTGLALAKTWEPGSLALIQEQLGDDFNPADAYAVFQLKRCESETYYVESEGNWVQDGEPTAPEEDTAFTRQNHQYRLDSTNTPTAWRQVVDNLPKTAETITGGRRTVIHYSYYFEEVDCNPSGFTAAFKDDQNHTIGTGEGETQVDTNNTTVTATNILDDGALKITKIPTINGVEVPFDQMDEDNISFSFNINGVEGTYTENVHHTVELTYVSSGENQEDRGWWYLIDNGADDGHRIRAARNTDGGWSICIPHLKPGKYTIEETNTGHRNEQDNIMDFVSVTGGYNDAGSDGMPPRGITATVVPGDEDAEQASAQVVYTNNRDFGCLGIEKIARISPSFGTLADTVIDGNYNFEITGPREKPAADRVTFTVSIRIQNGKMNWENAKVNGATIDYIEAKDLISSINSPKFVKIGDKPYGVIIPGLATGTYNVKETEPTDQNPPPTGSEVYLSSLVAYDREKTGTGDNTSFTDTRRDTLPFMRGNKIESINLTVTNAWDGDFNTWNIAEAKFTNELVPSTMMHRKEVLDVNDSDEESPFEPGLEHSWQDSADYDIGDSIPYRITGYLPQEAYQSKDSYYYRIDDAMQNLRYVNGTGHMFAFVKGPEDDAGTWYEVDEYFTITTPNAISGHDNTSWTNGTNDVVNYLQVTTKQQDGLKAIKRGYQTTWGDEEIFNNDQRAEPAVSGTPASINPNHIQYLQFRYKAELLTSANIGATGNANDAKIFYDNSQNPQTTTDPEWDRNRVFTYKLEVHKKDGDGNPLTGADFRLFKLYRSYKVQAEGWSIADFSTQTVSGGRTVEETLTLVGDPDGFPEGVSGVQSIPTGTILPINDEDDHAYYVQVPKTGTDPDFIWNGVDDGVYRLIEIKAPEDYALLDAPIGIRVSAGHDLLDNDPELFENSPSATVYSTVSGVNFTESAGVMSSDIINRNDIPVGFDIVKVKENDITEKLPGAKFAITMLNEGDGRYKTKLKEGSETEYELFFTDEEETDTDGMISFLNLSSGFYEIKETYAPNGYVLMEELLFYIRIENGTVSWVTKTATADGVTWTSHEPGKDGLITFAPALAASGSTPAADASFTVENTPGAELPACGGPGTKLIYLAGALLTMLGVAMLWGRKIRV